MLKKSLALVLAMAMLTNIAMPAHAEDAPVYDVDNYPPTFDGQQDLGPPPPSSPPSYPEEGYPAGSSSPPPPLNLEQRLSRTEQQINNMQRVNGSSKMETLQSEVQALRGQVEQLTHQLQQLQSQQSSQYADLDKRISNPTPSQVVNGSMSSNQDDIKVLRNQVAQFAQQLQALQNQPQKKVASTTSSKIKSTKQLSSATSMTKTGEDSPAPSVSDEATTGDQPNVAEEQQIYQTAYDCIKAKKYNDAINALQKMLKKYPSGQFAANAHYWLGELYGLLGNNEKSAAEFNRVLKNYPESPKVSDAQLKIGLIYAAQFKWSEAKSAFKKVINQYPGTASARLAAEQIKQIRSAGH